MALILRKLEQKDEAAFLRAIGSQKTIEKCGGVYERSVQGRESSKDVLKRRYWIDLSEK
jgi:predicted acetyltransferase